MKTGRAIKEFELKTIIVKDVNAPELDEEKESECGLNYDNRENNTLYVVRLRNGSETTLCFAIKDRRLKWLEFENKTDPIYSPLATCPENTYQRKIQEDEHAWSISDRDDSESPLEEGVFQSLQEKISEHLKAQAAKSIYSSEYYRFFCCIPKVSGLFTQQQSDNIIAVFGRGLLNDLVTLNKIILLDNQTNDHFSNLVQELRNTPDSKTLLNEAFITTTSQKANLLKDSFEFTDNTQKSKQLAYRIVGAIFAAFPAAYASGFYAGCKAGAILGLSAGAGVFSVPSALVAGAFGGLVGAYVGYCVGNSASNYFDSERAKADYSASIAKTLSIKK